MSPQAISIGPVECAMLQQQFPWPEAVPSLVEAGTSATAYVMQMTIDQAGRADIVCTLVFASGMRRPTSRQELTVYLGQPVVDAVVRWLVSGLMRMLDS